MKHSKYPEVLTLVNHKLPVLLTGEKGSGKTTIAMQIAEELELPFFNMSMTRQTTLSHLIGFMSVNGTYVGSQLRKVAETGGVFLIDEIDGGDANVLLSLNTIENGFISFPDGIIELHEDFRLIATSNPQDQHAHYVGRNKLDAATLDRFDIIDLPTDPELEKSLVDEDVYIHIESMRQALKECNSSIQVSMRDSKRYQKRKELGLLDGFMLRLCDHDKLAYELYEEKIKNVPKFADQSECKTVDDLFELMQQEKNN